MEEKEEEEEEERERERGRTMREETYLILLLTASLTNVTHFSLISYKQK